MQNSGLTFFQIPEWDSYLETHQYTVFYINSNVSTVLDVLRNLWDAKRSEMSPHQFITWWNKTFDEWTITVLSVETLKDCISPKNI
jgi:hypothetical protein